MEVIIERHWGGDTVHPERCPFWNATPCWAWREFQEKE